MKDPFKKLFKVHKEHLFSEDLSFDHLSKFEKKLEPTFPKEKPQPKFWLYLSGIAASLLLLITIGIFFNSTTPYNTIATTDLKKSEDFFTIAVQHKVKELKNYETPKTKPYIDKCLVSLSSLDADYQDLKIDFKKSGNNQLMNLMLNNLKKRIDILEQLITQFEYQKQQGYEL